MIENNNVELLFEARSENEAFARVVAAAFVTYLDPTIEELQDIKTAVSEAVTNAIVHGYDNGPGKVRMRLKGIQNQVIIEEQPKVKKENPHFLEANTLEVTMQHLKEDCITPVFAKDNELTIPHPAFIDTVYDAANTFFSGESIDKPDIRVSHIIKGRIPEAIHKPANQLLESDKNIYY